MRKVVCLLLVAILASSCISSGLNSANRQDESSFLDNLDTRDEVEFADNYDIIAVSILIGGVLIIGTGMIVFLDSIEPTPRRWGPIYSKP